jgi:hypothetical protein
MLRAALLVIDKKWYQSRCPSTRERLNKVWYIHIIEYYSAIKKNKLLIYTTTWMSLQGIILNKKKQTISVPRQFNGERIIFFSMWCLAPSWCGSVN